MYQKTLIEHFKVVNFMVHELCLNKEHVRHLSSKTKQKQKTELTKLMTDVCQKILPKHLVCHLCPSPPPPLLALCRLLFFLLLLCSPIKCWHSRAPSCTFFSSPSAHAHLSTSMMSAPQTPKFRSPSPTSIHPYSCTPVPLPQEIAPPAT